MTVTRAYVSRSRLRHNIRTIRNRIQVPACIALKADAYGHGAVETAKVALEEGVSSFGLARLSEASVLDDAGITGRYILFSVLADDEIEEAVNRGYELFTSDFDYIRLIEEKARKIGAIARIHIKTDTGMHRIGLDAGEAVEAAKWAYASRWLEIAGVCTHLAAADQKDNPFTRTQLQRFSAFLETLKESGIDYGTAHAANSGGVFYHPASGYSMVRPGISVYGYPPSPKDGGLGLKPVMELVSSLVQIRKVHKGEAVSYGLTQAPERDSYIGTVAIGYGDGYSRLLSSKGKMCINGELYPVIGRVCMDQCLVNLGPDCRVSKEDPVIVFGPDPPAWDADDTARAMGTISYEITCAVSSRVPRVYID